MIYERHNTEEELSLFEQPEQLLLLREHLILLLQKNQHNKNDASYMFQLQAVNDPELKQEQTINNLLQHIQQTEQQIIDLNSQMHTVAEITVKMIDYLTCMQQKRVDQILHHQDQIQHLKAQLQIATYKNNLIEGDIELFRERLMVAQSEMEDIERNEQTKESKQVRDLQNQRKIQLLEQELERISQQLNVCKLHFTHKEPQVGSLDRIMNSNMSEKLIKIKRMSSVIISNPFIPSQETADLQQRIKILQRQNQILRYELETLRENYCLYQLQYKEYNLQTHEFQEQHKLQPSIDASVSNPQIMNKVSSTSFLKSAAKEQHEMSHNMVSHQSIEKFHTLSSQWSSKSFQNNLFMFNMDSNLIYLSNQDEERQHYQKSCIPETKETENSLPDSEVNLKNKISLRAKCVSEVGVNTDTQIQTNSQSQFQTVYNLNIKPTKQYNNLSNQRGVQNILNEVFRKLAMPLISLKKRAVDYRISRVLRQRSKEI